MKRLCSIMVCALLILTACNGKKDYTGSIPEEFDAYCTSAFNNWKIPGMSVVVVKDGKVVYLKGFGYAKMADSTGAAKSVDPTNTKFVIASTTKAFTGALLANVMDEVEDLKWDDPVIKHLPDFRLYDKWAQENIMVKEVMAHHTGFKTYALDDLPIFGYDRDDLYRLLGAIRPSYSFRSKYAYNNEMYIVAAKIIEKYTGKSWDDAIAERLFAPLEMTHSTTGNKAFKSDTTLALGYRVSYDAEGDSLKVEPRRDREDAFTWLSAVAPAAFVMTTAADLGNWLKMHLAGGEFNGKQIISKENHAALFKPQTVTSFDDDRICTYGQGWTVEQSSKCRYIRHTGLAYGYTSLVGFVPELNLGFAFLTNNGKTSDAQAAIARQLIDMYLGEEGKDYSAEYLAEFIDSSKPKEKDEEKGEEEEEILPPLPLTQYTGKYKEPDFGEASLYMKEGELWFKLKGVESRLEHKSGHVFRFRVPGAGRFDLTFKVKGKRVVSFTFDINDPIGDFKRI